MSALLPANVVTHMPVQISQTCQKKCILQEHVSQPDFGDPVCVTCQQVQNAANRRSSETSSKYDWPMRTYNSICFIVCTAWMLYCYTALLFIVLVNLSVFLLCRFTAYCSTVLLSCCFTVILPYCVLLSLYCFTALLHTKWTKAGLVG